MEEKLLHLNRLLDITIKSDVEVSVEDLKTSPVFLVGTPTSNRVLARLRPQLPIVFQDDGFVFHGKLYQDTTDVITFLYPNPENFQYPLFITTGNQDSWVIKYLLHGLPLGSALGNYEILHQGKLLVYGSFSQDKTTRWQVDAEKHHDFEQEAPLAQETDHYRFYLHKKALKFNELELFARQREETYQRIQVFLGNRPSSLSKIDYYIFARGEDKGMFLAPVEEDGWFATKTQFTHYDIARNQVHIALQEGIGDQWPREVILLARRALGESKKAILETGLGIIFSKNWQEKGYEYWASRLYLAGIIPPLKELLNNDMVKNESPFIVEPLAGTLVNFLIDTWGRESFLKNYSHWNPASHEIRRLEQGWHLYLRQIADKHLDRIKQEQDRTVFSRAIFFYKGFNYAHQGESVRIRMDNGYLSRMSDQSLEKLRAIGVNAIAIVPYTYMNDRHKPSPLLPLRDFNKETDDGVIHALLTAKQLGMSVMLKPQIQGRIDWPGKIGWPGFIAMNTEAEWDSFFYYYTRWIRHYALMAEMYQAEVFCVGNELIKATLHNENRWIELIRKLRKIYSGQIVYAANWGEEFERLTFWDTFDFIGINSYYPISEKDDPTDEELKKGADVIVKRIEAVHKRYSKPVLFTEIGFPNRKAPWKQPYDKKHDAPINFEHQARCYDVMFKALEGKSWVHGIFWWRWPVGFKIASDEFTLGDHAEQIVASWYKQRL